MSTVLPAANESDAAGTAVRFRTNRVFRPARVSMPREAANRQAQVTASAWRAIGDAQRLMAFFNTDHPALPGRPLDVAIASDAGLARVERLLAELNVEEDTSCPAR